MDEIKDIFSNFTSLPYLFIGSGISRRYLGLPDWEGLLRHLINLYSDHDLAFEYYVNNAKRELSNLGISDDSLILPMVASLIEADFNDAWFKDDKFASNRMNSKDKITMGISPFKLEVANYIKSASNESNLISEYEHEIELFKEIANKSINGIITTNYDLLVQELFKNKDYDCFIGQEDLIFSPPNGIREIYKIHGCCTDPNSIIITYEDYVEFRKKNAYIAAKLLTIFVEHPIIFFGYSIDDPNIINILESIVVCLNEEKIEQLKNRLFFIQRNKEPGYIKTTDFVRQFNNNSIPMKKIELNDFSLVYEALLDVKAKYNPRVLKILKNDIYNLVVTNDTDGSVIATTHIDDNNLDNIEVIVGVGLKNLAKNGIVGISTVDIFTDLIMDNFDFLSMPEFRNEFVTKTLSEQLSRSSYSLPVFKYIDDADELPLNIQNYISDKINLDSFLSNSLKRSKKWSGNPKSISEILYKYDDLDTQMIKIAILDEDRIDLDDLKTYLHDLIIGHEDILTGKHSTNIRRLIKIYDFLKYKK